MSSVKAAIGLVRTREGQGRSLNMLPSHTHPSGSTPHSRSPLTHQQSNPREPRWQSPDDDEHITPPSWYTKCTNRTPPDRKPKREPVSSQPRAGLELPQRPATHKALPPQKPPQKHRRGKYRSCCLVEACDTWGPWKSMPVPFDALARCTSADDRRFYHGCVLFARAFFWSDARVSAS